MPKYSEVYGKMWVLRQMAKEMPGEIVDDILKMLDKTWDEEIQKLQPTKKKYAFVTKF